MSNYTVLLFTFNEEFRIEFILKNFIDRAHVVVLDGGSTDKTLEIAKLYGATIIKRPDFNANYNNAALCKWALEQAETEYVFIAYCSFFVPKELLDVFDDVALSGRHKAVKHGYSSITYGKFVDTPFVRRRSSACHFFAKSAIDFSQSMIHEEWPLKNDKPGFYLLLPSLATFRILVFRDYDTRKTEVKHSKYSDTEALERFNRGERTGVFKMLYRAIFEFLYGYIRCGGICGGVPGFMYWIWRAQMVFNIQTRIWEYQNNMQLADVEGLHATMRAGLLKDDFRSDSVKSQDE